MTKWLITRARTGRRWEIANFTGPGGAESMGIVDLLAIRKDHRALDVPRGDYFEMILIQVKGGNARWPTAADIDRLRLVKERYNARAVLLAAWTPGSQPKFYSLGDPDPGLTPRRIWGEALDATPLFR